MNTQYAAAPLPPSSYGYGGGAGAPRAQMGGMRSSQPQVQQNKSRRLYVGNIPYHVGISENGMVQLFSALYVAGFRQLAPGEQLPVTSFWLHSDGKFGFMELRGDQEAVDCMQFNGLILHGRPLRVNRPSDYRPDHGLQLGQSQMNPHGVVDLCNQLQGLVAPPVHIANAAMVTPPPPPRSAPAYPQQQMGGTAPVVTAPPSSLSGQNGAPTSAPPLGPNSGGGAAPLMLRSQPAAAPASQPPPPPPPASSAPPPPSAAEPSSKSPMTVLALDHIVQDEDLNTPALYEELLLDVRQECESYGTVLEVSIPKMGPGRGTAFVSYETRADAEKAIIGLQERVFENQAIMGVIVPNQTSAEEAAANYKPPSST
jgi:RNA recognition motif. (a.k.a. RRM, RBD, or RNP domain)